MIKGILNDNLTTKNPMADLKVEEGLHKALFQLQLTAVHDAVILGYSKHVGEVLLREIMFVMIFKPNS